MNEAENRTITLHVTHSDGKKPKPLFVTNRIRTTKYTILTFLPKNLFFQFSRIANFYFLIIVSLLQFPWAPISANAALLPLSFVIGVSAIREAIEDFLRYRSDQQINKSLTYCLNKDGEFIQTRWDSIYVGDIIKIHQDEQAPADIVLLATSEDTGSCYIETCNLDGETNLKTRESLHSTCKITDFSNFKAKISYDPPNKLISAFNGNLEIDQYGNEGENASSLEQNIGHQFSLNNKQLVLRGSSLKNTEWAVGAVVYTGHETKIMMNSSSSRTKRSYLERGLNLKLISIFIFLFLLSLITAIFGILFEKNQINTGKHWYFYRKDSPRNGAKCFIVIFLSQLIVMNTMIPISLYVTLEVVRIIQAYFIVFDSDMYDEETNSFASSRTTNISDDLGQIKYIFSDKTGTLTQNVMEFMKCSIGDKSFGDGTTEVEYSAAIRNGLSCRPPTISGKAFSSIEFNSLLHELQTNESPSNQYSNEFKKEVQLFLWLLATCHSVIPKEDSSKPHGIEFQASSPDESALVLFAADFGYIFKNKTHNSLTVQVNGVDHTTELLANLEFSSERKRSSVILRFKKGDNSDLFDDDTIVLFCKGADDLIYQRLSPQSMHQFETRSHMRDFANAGLRTLCCSYKIIDKETFDNWYQRYYDATCQITDRDQKVEEVSNEIENDLLLLGATAIQDRLQVGVSNTIASLLKAKVNIWVITGDKKETAINIGFACSLLTSDMIPIIFDSDNQAEIRSKLNVILEDIQSESIYTHGHNTFASILGGGLHPPSKVFHSLNNELIDLANTSNQAKPSDRHLALIASGEALEAMLSSDFTFDDFLSIAIKCRSVICCRVSPIQKATIVEQMRKKTKQIVLAIGDGANDVGMILKADVGVGISGKEGRQAVLVSDYAISQFRFLKKLLLVHGRLNFYRNIDLINYSFYKNMAISFIQFIYASYSSFSGRTLYDSILFMTFNVVFTCFPPIVYACLDKDVSIESMMSYPELYDFDNGKKYLQSYLRFWLNLLLGIFNAFICFYIPYLGMFPYVTQRGKTLSLIDFGTSVYCSVVIVTNLNLAIKSLNWTWIHHLFIWVSIFIFPVVSIVVAKLDLSVEFDGSGLSLFTNNTFWIAQICTTILSILPLVTYYVITNGVSTFLNKVKLKEHLHRKNTKDPSFSDSLVSTKKKFIIPEISELSYPDRQNQTGFAFSPPESISRKI